MAFFASLINKFIANTDHEHNRHYDHYDKLELLRKNHERIDVKITQTDQYYQSLIIALDPDNHELLIDELYPNDALSSLQNGDTLEITSKINNAKLSFYTRILSQELIDGKAALCVELPEEIGRNHNRHAYRVSVANEAGLRIDIHHQDKLLNDVRIVNLSSEGIKLSFADDLCEQLKHDRALNDCVIVLPTNLDVDCSIDLRNIYRIRTPHPHTLAGGVLTIHNPQHRVKLEQYIAAVQRQQRRRESRSI